VLTSPYGLLPLLTVKGKPTAALFPAGKGTVAILTSGSLLTNKGILERDNGLFILNLVTYLCPDKRLHLAEPFWGRHASGVTTLVWATPGRRWACLQVLFLACLYLWSIGSRFRPAQHRSDVGRRGPQEYVEAMADLHRSAQATGPALANISDTFLMDVRKRFGQLEPERPLDCLPLLHRLGKDRLALLGALLVKIRRTADSGRPPLWMARSLARQLTSFRKELNVT